MFCRSSDCFHFSYSLNEDRIILSASLRSLPNPTRPNRSQPHTMPLSRLNMPLQSLQCHCHSSTRHCDSIQCHCHHSTCHCNLYNAIATRYTAIARLFLEKYIAQPPSDRRLDQWSDRVKLYQKPLAKSFILQYRGSSVRIVQQSKRHLEAVRPAPGD
jgi:hypothetical protein